MRVLYIGGTGEISYDCVHQSVSLGHDVSVFNRGNNNDGLPTEVSFITGDIHDDGAYGGLAKENFDVICQFRLFSADEIERDIEVFTGHCGQYVLISSASAYQKPVRGLPITEQTPLDNPYWGYSQAKAEMERVLRAQSGLKYTIVRPSHTYRTHMPTPFDGNIVVSRLLRGKPIVVPGDGEALWTITHAEDFAPPFAKLLGNRRALGEDFHIVGEKQWPWNEILQAIAAALGVTGYRFVHVPTDTLVRYNPDYVGPLKGGRAMSVIFDNSKVKSVVGDYTCWIDPWAGMRKVAARFLADAEDYDAQEDVLHDRIVAEQSALGE